jgi:hypothetical protein
MKINEIPEKIYLSYETDNEDDKDHIFIDYMWHRHPFEGRNLENIEYTRTDAFIEKVCVKLKKLMYDNLMFQGRLHREEVIDNFIEDFKKYMEGE